MSTVIGIDLGTTNSVVAHVDETGRPRVVPNALGKATTPSVVCFYDDGRVVVGDEAKEQQDLALNPVAAFFKREIGSEYWIFTAHGRSYDAVELSSIVLRQLREDAEAELGSPISKAVITVPAYFRDAERRATIEAGEKAGLEVLQVVNEPTAAAIAFGMKEAESARTLLVFDLGGGTFDVTLLDAGPDSLRVRASLGDDLLGGRDWDERVLDFLSSRFQEEFGVDPLEDAESRAALAVSAE